MPIFTIPNGDPLLEGNDCHNPAGSPAGGEFCSKGERAHVVGAGASLPELAQMGGRVSTRSGQVRSVRRTGAKGRYFLSGSASIAISSSTRNLARRGS